VSENWLSQRDKVRTFTKWRISTVALFYSFANGTQSVYRDIDIAISKEKDFVKNNSSYDYFNTLSMIKSKIKKKFYRNIDIFDLDSNSSLKALSKRI